MNTSNPSHVRDLLARLSDGMLAREEAEQLNELLLADPIAQELYLDHMLIDGLLEREFGGVPFYLASAEPNPMGVENAQLSADPLAGRAPVERHFLRARGVLWSLVPSLAIALVVASWLLWGFVNRGTEGYPLTLANSGFEEGQVVFMSTPSKAAWAGDLAEIITRYSGVTPQEGRQMVRFLESVVGEEDACELYQTVELGDAASIVADRPTTVEASAFFNAIETESHSAFDITVFAYSADPTTNPDVWPTQRERAQVFNGSQIRADADARTWQQVSARLDLPADTRYLVIRLSAYRDDPKQQNKKFPGHFVDNVSLNLTSL